MRFILFWLLSFSTFSAVSEDLLNDSDELLLEDEFSFESDSTDVNRDSSTSIYEDFLAASTFSLSSDVMQSKRIDLLRSSAKYGFERSYYTDFFLKFSGEYEYVHPSDRLARQNNKAYSNLDINEFWLQYSKKQCNLKAGKQTLFWGNVEGAYVVDVISPLDTTQPLLTDFASIRQAQNILVTNCYSDLGNVELAWIMEPKVLRSSDRQLALNHQLERDLDSEYALRYSNSYSKAEISLMLARTYENNPSITIPSVGYDTTLIAPKSNTYGLSAVWALEQLLLEIDLAYKTNQLISGAYLNTELFKPVTKDSSEAAIGFEYLTNSNHQFSGGVYFFKNRADVNINAKPKWEQNYTLSWSKDYVNDTLNLSLLSGWQTANQNFFGAIQADYEWNDYWKSDLALIINSQYRENAINNQMSDNAAIYLSTTLTF